MSVLVLFFVAARAVQGQATNVSQCIWQNAELPLFTHIEGCESWPCIAPQGEDVVVNIIFKAPRAMVNMRTLVTKDFPMMPVAIPFNLGERGETCNYLVNSACPVKEGQMLWHSLRLPISEILPVGTVVAVELRVTDENNAPIVCLRTFLQIERAISSRESRKPSLTAQ